MNRRSPTREVTPDELELLAFESGAPIVFGLDLATLRTEVGTYWSRIERASA